MESGMVIYVNRASTALVAFTRSFSVRMISTITTLPRSLIHLLKLTNGYLDGFVARAHQSTSGNRIPKLLARAQSRTLLGQVGLSSESGSQWIPGNVHKWRIDWSVPAHNNDCLDGQQFEEGLVAGKQLWDSSIFLFCYRHMLQLDGSYV